MPMTYRVYENWRAQGHYTKIHRSECGSCKNGQGVHPNSGHENGAWHGPFASLHEATTQARAKSSEVSACQRCLRASLVS